jgi:hypothetical protein
MSVVRFPVCRRVTCVPVGPNQVVDDLYWHGGRGFKTKEAVVEAMSDKDYRRTVEWETRNRPWLASQQRHDGDKQQGGGNAAR